MDVQYNYHVTGSGRKALVKAINSILGSPVVYQGTPTFAYAIGGYKLDREGILHCPDNVSPEETGRLIQKLREQGFAADPLTADCAGSFDTVTEPRYPMAFAVEMPKAGFTETALVNLQKMIASKETLLKKALGTDILDIVMKEDRLCFPWFTLHEAGGGEADAYSRFIAALCRMAKEQKRVTAKRCDTENEKFHMRLFVVRLGFIGDEYKAARKILLQNLNGNSSWKSGHDPRQKRGRRTS